ncbi:hypothetical protein KCU91_g46, partial [Aureobasidium melanogenum]
MTRRVPSSRKYQAQSQGAQHIPDSQGALLKSSRSLKAHAEVSTNQLFPSTTQKKFSTRDRGLDCSVFEAARPFCRIDSVLVDIENVLVSSVDDSNGFRRQLLNCVATLIYKSAVVIRLYQFERSLISKAEIRNFYSSRNGQGKFMEWKGHLEVYARALKDMMMMYAQGFFFQLTEVSRKQLRFHADTTSSSTSYEAWDTSIRDVLESLVVSGNKADSHSLCRYECGV